MRRYYSKKRSTTDTKDTTLYSSWFVVFVVLLSLHKIVNGFVSIRAIRGYFICGYN
jgi:hypothetical protein